MMNKQKLAFVLIVLFSLSLACSDFLPGRDVPDESTVSSGDVLFEDDFSKTSSGWDRHQGTEGITDYADDAYRILVNLPNYDVWTNPYLDFTDVIIEVDATKSAGPDDNDFGVICRYQADNQGDETFYNFYYFIISSDGFYAIIKFKNNTQEFIQMEMYEYSSEINQGNTTNHIRADCIGNQLSLFVNGTLLAYVSDSDFTSGDVGLIAGTFDTPGTDILFDNFIVVKP